jgi:hypothetical protein
MSYFCQFCDKEMLLEQSIVYEKDYITCGNHVCTQKARKTASDLTTEASIKTTKLLIFKTTTPEECSTWRVVPKDQYPSFFNDKEVLRGLFDGCVVSLQPADESEAEVFYCARHVDEVLRQLQSEREKAGTA